jgi:nitrogen fixation protein FixH
MVEFHDKTGAPIPDLAVTARFRHPFDAAQDLSVPLVSDGDNYEGVAAPIAHGRWTLIIEGNRGAARLFRSENQVTVTDTVSD